MCFAIEYALLLFISKFISLAKPSKMITLKKKNLNHLQHKFLIGHKRQVFATKILSTSYKKTLEDISMGWKTMQQ